MRLLDNFKIATGALLSNPLRSLLSLLGVIIGVFAVTALISLGEMATYGIRKNLEDVAGRSIVVQPNFEAGEVTRFTPDDLRLLLTLPVKALPVVTVQAQTIDSKGKPINLQIQGSPAGIDKLNPSLELAEGRFFGAGELRSASAAAVLSSGAKQRLFHTGSTLGQVVRVRFFGNQVLRMTVVGVTKPAGGVLGQFDRPTVYVPYTFLWKRLPRGLRNTFDFIELKVEPGVPLDAVEKRVRRLMTLRYGEGRVQIVNVQMFQNVLKNVTSGLQALLGGIGALALLVGGIGIMNIMLVSVTERTREIGLRKALGATSAQVRAQFLIEAVLLTLGGGVIGVLLAAAVLYAIVLAAPFFQAFILSPRTVVLALGVSAAVGLFFGVWPADQAARLDPIEALRHE